MVEEARIYPWGHNRRFNDFASHFKKLFSGRVQKVSVDAGFTCPNRDGTVGKNGCTYCNNTSFKPDYCKNETTVTDQIEKGISFFERKYKDMRYVAYFQAYTNTHAPLSQLMALYEEAIQHPKVIGLVIATRPDCLTEAVLDYLQKLAKKMYVMVELGVESVKNNTLIRINRGHTFEQSCEAIIELNRRQIHNGAHVILGLPGESRGDILMQAHELSRLPLENIKLHQLQIHKNTIMQKDFEKNPNDYNLFENVHDYIDVVIEYLERLRPSVIVERFISQSPQDLLVAPKWGIKNFEFVAKLEKELEKRDTWQGRLFQTDENEVYN